MGEETISRDDARRELGKLEADEKPYDPGETIKQQARLQSTLQQIRVTEAAERKAEQEELRKQGIITLEESTGAVGGNTPEMVQLGETKEQTIRTIKAGDNLYKLAKEYSISITQLVELNKDSPKYKQYKQNPRLIQVGDILVVPNAKATESLQANASSPELGAKPNGDLGSGASKFGSVDGTITSNIAGLDFTKERLNRIGNGYPEDNPNYLRTKISAMQPTNLTTESQTWKSGSGAVLMSDYGPVTTQFDDNRVNEIKTPTLSAKPDGSTLTKARDPAPAEAQIPDRTSENTELLSNSGFKIGDKVTSPMPGEENIALTILSVHPNKQGEVILKNEKNNTKISCLISELLKAPTPVIEVNNSKSRDITPETIKDVEKFGINVEKLKMINSYGLKIVFTPAGSNNSGDTIDIEAQGRPNTIHGERSNGTILRINRGFSIHSNENNQQKFENISIKTLHGVPMLQFDLGFNDNYFGKSFSIAPYGNMEGADKAAKMDNFGLSHGMIDFLEKNNIQMNPNTMQDFYPKNGYAFGSPYTTGYRHQDYIPDGDSIKKMEFKADGNTKDGYVTMQLQSGYTINIEPRIIGDTKKIPTEPNPINMGKSGVPMEAKKFGLTPDHIRLLSRYGLNATFESKWQSPGGAVINDRIDIKDSKERNITYSTNKEKGIQGNIFLTSDEHDLPNNRISRIEEREVGDKTVLFIEENNFKYYYIDKPTSST